MERVIKGDIVVFNFPFLDSSDSKKRPALVLANTYKNIILCQITSKITPDPNSVSLNQNDFKSGDLKNISFAKLSVLFSINESRINYKVGSLKKEKIIEIQNKLCDMFKK